MSSKKRKLADAIAAGNSLAHQYDTLLEQCRLAGGDCTQIRACIGSSCACIGPQCQASTPVIPPEDTGGAIGLSAASSS